MRAFLMLEYVKNGRHNYAGDKVMVNAADIFNASILVVDDQQENVRLLVQMLRDAGYLSITSTTDPYTVCDI